MAHNERGPRSEPAERPETPKTAKTSSDITLEELPEYLASLAPEHGTIGRLLVEIVEIANQFLWAADDEEICAHEKLVQMAEQYRDTMHMPVQGLAAHVKQIKTGMAMLAAMAVFIDAEARTSALEPVAPTLPGAPTFQGFVALKKLVTIRAKAHIALEKKARQEGKEDKEP